MPVKKLSFSLLRQIGVPVLAFAMRWFVIWRRWMGMCGYWQNFVTLVIAVTLTLSLTLGVVRMFAKALVRSK